MAHDSIKEHDMDQRKMYISPSARISPLCDIESSQKGSKLRIGAESVIDSFVKVKFAGGQGDIIMGQSCYINSGCVLYSGHGILMGDNVLIAANCVLAPTNHCFYDKMIPIKDQGFMSSKGGIIIENNVWIGAGSIILDGSHIGTGCVIAANAVVRGKLDAYCVYGGNPLSKIKAI